MSNVKVSVDEIMDILDRSTISFHTAFDKCTVAECQLPNGFVIIESSACVNPEDYDEFTGSQICMDKIEERLWELYGFDRHQQIYETMP